MACLVSICRTIPTWLVIGSSPSPFHLVAQSLKFLNDPIPMVALNFDSPFLDSPASAKPLLQLCGKLSETIAIQRHVGNNCHSLSSPALGLPAHSDDGGLAWGRWLALASAC